MNINIDKLEITETFSKYDGMDTLSLFSHNERQFIRYWILETKSEIGFLLSEINNETLNLFKDNKISLNDAMLKMKSHYKIIYPIEQKSEYKEIKTLNANIIKLSDYKGEDLPEKTFFFKDFYNL
jgi:hypothetical protein